MWMGEIIDFDNHDEIIKFMKNQSDKIKKLEKENKQLKSEVFELIDKKINKLENINEVSLIPRESVEILKELKKELYK